MLKFISTLLDKIRAHLQVHQELERCCEDLAELTRRNHFLQHILDAATTRIWHFDREVRVVSLNKAAQANLEYPLETYLGKTTFDYFHNMDDAHFYYKLDKKVIDTGQPDLGRLDIYEAPDGQTYYKEVDRIPYFDEHGQIAGITVYSYDISEQKRAEIQLREEIEKRIAAEEELRCLAATDPLTGAFNRRHFFELAERELARAHRTQRAFSILLFDIDHFKHTNDTYGHLAGDQVLQSIVVLCQENLRAIDVFARYGGEEFVILLPETETTTAVTVAEKIRALIAETSIEFDQKTIAVTISLGVSTFSFNDGSLDQLLARTDEALYQAKAAGRNQVVVG